MSNKIIGILGGMGPAATADMFQKFIAATSAQCDQEHIPLLISSIPTIPDRSAHLLSGKENPYPAMLEHTERLKKAGANCIVIACNTAHYWFNDLQQASQLKMISMIDTTVDAAKRTGKQTIGILATNATLATELYKNKIQNEGLTYLAPDAESQPEVMKSIYLYKAGKTNEATTLMRAQQQKLFEQGAQTIILGCTEVPLILAQDMVQQPNRYIDATAELVKATIAWYRE